MKFTELPSPIHFALMVEYDGSAFFGSQRQLDVRTVQGELDQILSNCLNERISTKFSGRTDSGVHALGQVISFFSDNASKYDFRKFAQECFCVNDLSMVHKNNPKYDIFKEFSPDVQTWYHEKFYNYLKINVNGKKMEKMYDNLIKSFPELDEYDVDWRNRYSHEEPDNDLPYNPWTKWDEKCIKGGDGWMFMKMKDIDGEYLVNKEVKFKPLVTENTITGQRGLMYPYQTVFKLKPESDFLLEVLENDREKRK